MCYGQVLNQIADNSSSKFQREFKWRPGADDVGLSSSGAGEGQFCTEVDFFFESGKQVGPLCARTNGSRSH